MKQSSSSKSVPSPSTVAEASGWKRTSTHAEALDFVRALAALPAGERLAVETFGYSEEGRELVCVTVAEPLPAGLDALRDDPRLRVLVNANIHAGEVEGKEAVQILLRELATGEHSELLERVALVFVPVYNPDGNDRIDRKNRVDQNGPDEGVGTRANARELDLNRDFVKVESAECRALLGLMRRTDPHVFMDLHTTDGSYHGYHLTYSPSLSTNVAPELDDFARATLFPAVRRAMLADHGYRVFDYGNLEGEPRAWATYDHRPRFGTNYNGLRNRISILSEAYSHLDFEARVRVTHAFVLECLEAARQHEERIRAICSQADANTPLRRSNDDRAQGSFSFGFASELAPASEGIVLVGAVDEVELEGGLGKRLVARSEYESVAMPVKDRFRSTRWLELPEAWLIPEPEDAEIEVLSIHGVEFARLAAPATLDVRAFRPSAVRKSQRPFQGHHEIELEGDWFDEERTLPAGTLIITSRQRLARVAAQLLEPQSEDSLSTWNVFEARTRADAPGEPGRFPVLRLEAAAELSTTPVPPLDPR